MVRSERRAGPELVEAKPEKRNNRELLNEALDSVEHLKVLFNKDPIRLARVEHTLKSARDGVANANKGGDYPGTIFVELQRPDGGQRVQHEGVPVEEVINLLREGADALGKAGKPGVSREKIYDLADKLEAQSLYYFDAHFPRSGKLVNDQPKLGKKESAQQHFRTQMEANYIHTWTQEHPEYRTALLEKYGEQTTEQGVALKDLDLEKQDYYLAMEVMRNRRELVLDDVEEKVSAKKSKAKTKAKGIGRDIELDAAIKDFHGKDGPDGALEYENFKKELEPEWESAIDERVLSDLKKQDEFEAGYDPSWREREKPKTRKLRKKSEPGVEEDVPPSPKFETSPLKIDTAELSQVTDLDPENRIPEAPDFQPKDNVDASGLDQVASLEAENTDDEKLAQVRSNIEDISDEGPAETVTNSDKAKDLLKKVHESLKGDYSESVVDDFAALVRKGGAQLRKGWDWFKSQIKDSGHQEYEVAHYDYLREWEITITFTQPLEEELVRRKEEADFNKDVASLKNLIEQYNVTEDVPLKNADIIIEKDDNPYIGFNSKTNSINIPYRFIRGLSEDKDKQEHLKQKFDEYIDDRSDAVVTPRQLVENRKEKGDSETWTDDEFMQFRDNCKDNYNVVFSRDGGVSIPKEELYEYLNKVGDAFDEIVEETGATADRRFKYTEILLSDHGGTLSVLHRIDIVNLNKDQVKRELRGLLILE